MYISEKKLASKNVSTFNAKFFVPFLKNLNKKNKEVTSTGDFNMNLLNLAKKRGTHQFLELFHNNYTPQITLPTRITDRLATLINNIFLNTQRHKRTSGNITTSISDHLHQFTILDKFLATRNIVGKEQIVTLLTSLFIFHIISLSPHFIVHVSSHFLKSTLH